MVITETVTLTEVIPSEFAPFARLGTLGRLNGEGPAITLERTNSQPWRLKKGAAHSKDLPWQIPN